MIKKLPLRRVITYVIINFFLFIVSFPVLAIWGPLPNIKSAFVGAVATSRHHAWLNAFMDQKEIDQIMAAPNRVKQISLRLPSFINRHSGNIKLTEINGDRFKGYLLEINDPTRIKVGFSRNLGEKGQKTSDIAVEADAIAAINAGGFDDPAGKGSGGIPYGVVIHDGYYLAGDELKGKVNLVGFTKSGKLIVGSYTIGEMKTLGIMEGISFSPPLIVNGKQQISGGDGGWGIAPRTAIGQRKDGTVLMLVIDGRQPPYSIGATLLDVQNILYENGAYVAGNLDGGSSTAMYYNGKLVNNPSNLMGLLGERPVPTVFLVK